MSLFSHIFSIFWWIHCAPCYIQSCESTLLLINWCLSTIRLLWCWVIVRIVLLAEHIWLIHCNCLFNCWQVFTQEDWMLWLNQSVLQQSISLGVYTPMQPAYCTFSLTLYFLIHFCPNRLIFFFFKFKSSLIYCNNNGKSFEIIHCSFISYNHKNPGIFIEMCNFHIHCKINQSLKSWL